MNCFKEVMPFRDGGMPAFLLISLVLAMGGSPSTYADSSPDAVRVSVEQIHFGDIDRAGTFDGTATITFRAPLGVSLRIALNGGLSCTGGWRNVKRQNGAELIPYQLYKDASRTQPWGDSDLDNTFPQGTSFPGKGTGSDQRATIFGRLMVSSLPPPDLYLDNVLVTVYY